MQRFLRFVVVLTLLVSMAPAGWAEDATRAEMANGAPVGDGPWIVRAYNWTEETVEELGTYFDHMGVYRDKGMLLIHLDNRYELDMLLMRGLRVEVDEQQTAVLRHLEAALASGYESINTIPGFECYRTVEETMATADALVAAYPTLATYIDIGDSWEKTQPGGLPGYDLKVLKLTNSAIAGDKPDALYFGSTHSREYTTAELVTRFAEWMLANYGVDPDVTWVLDHHELHLLLIANPDGRKKAETGLSWRKNTDSDDGCGDPNSWGTDLNRNWDFRWGCCGGSSSAPCATTYRGPSAASEPEALAFQAYQAAIYQDYRPGDPLDLTIPASLDAEGLYIDFHSFGQVMLVPWSFFSNGCSGSPPTGCAPNWDGLLTLARKYSYFPGYEAFLGSTGIVDGASKDYSYGTRGVPGYTVELGTAFFESCANFENIIWPDNLPGMLQISKSIRRPYTEPGGPDTVDPSVPQIPVTAGTFVDLTATADDTRFSPLSPGDPDPDPTQNIAAAEFYLDTPWWNGGTPIAMAATDGSFDETIEAIEASVDTTSMSADRHTLFLRAQDTDGNWGATSAQFLYVIDPATSPVLQGTVTDFATGTPLEATVEIGPFAVMSAAGSGAYSLQVPPGIYDVTASALGYAPETVEDVVLAALDVVTENFRLSPLEVLFSDDVEGGNAGWTADAPWAITTEASNSPTHSWTDSPGGNHGDNLDISLTSPVFDLSEKQGTTLSFSHIYDLESGFDIGSVEVTPDGSTWTSVVGYSLENQNLVWMDEVLTVPMLDGSATAQVRFRLTSDTNTNRDGWHVDDIVLEAADVFSAVIFSDGFESGDVTAWSNSVP